MTTAMRLSAWWGWGIRRFQMDADLDIPIMSLIAFSTRVRRRLHPKGWELRLVTEPESPS